MVKSLSNLKTIYIKDYKKFDKIDNASLSKELKIELSKENKKNMITWSGRRDSNPRLQPWQGCFVSIRKK